MFCVIRTELYTIRVPSVDTLGWARKAEGVVTDSGSPMGRPASGSTAMRQRFMLPPRSLEK